LTNHQTKELESTERGGVFLKKALAGCLLLLPPVCLPS
jgi:hypothetical protein